MDEDLTKKFSKSNPNKLDLILLTLQRLQEDLQMAKCQIKTSVQEIALRQNVLNNSLFELHRDLRDIDERLHGIELTQERQNSVT